MQLGIDRLLNEEVLSRQLKSKRVALLGHPASVTSAVIHSLDALMKQRGNIKITAAFGPQHGMRGDKQDNMIETQDYIDPEYNIPIFSLYGEVRKPTANMMQSFDVLLVDMQDVGTRIYTFLTTLRYMLEACAQYGKAIWILDRPNPAGRPVEGSLLKEGWESFVGSGPLPMRHGLTMAEAALWFKKTLKLDVDLKIVEMKDYDPSAQPGFGWPLGELTWVNPSPNAATLSMARCFPGTVLIEGTTLSEGRGTTRPLEMVGASDINQKEVFEVMKSLAPQWLKGGVIRPCFFEPTFHKHVGKLCHGFQMHVDAPFYQHEVFKPYRIISLWLKAIRTVHPEYNIWRDFNYEYVKGKLPFDIINGSTILREWVDNTRATVSELESVLIKDETMWLESRSEYLLY